jgi:hypothetical protein
MGTKGTIKLIYNGKTIILYSQLDSYLSSMGIKLIYELIELLDKYSIEKIKSMLENIEVVYFNCHQSYRKPTADEISKLSTYTDLGVSEQSTDDWYCLLRMTQGSIKKTLNAGYALYISDWEEYNYIVDFDNMTFKCTDYIGRDRWSTELKIDKLKLLPKTDLQANSDDE